MTEQLQSDFDKIIKTSNISKKDMEILIEKAANTAPAQTIRLEQAPMVIAPSGTPKK